MKKTSLLLISFLSLGSVSAGYSPTYTFNQLQIVNLSTTAITEVSLQIGGSDRILRCDMLAKNAVCDGYYGRRTYPQQVNKLSWTEGDGTQKSQDLSPMIAAYESPGLPMRVVVELHEDGLVETKFEQDGGCTH
jgi:hypothetical protein